MWLVVQALLWIVGAGRREPAPGPVSAASTRRLMHDETLIDLDDDRRRLLVAAIAGEVLGSGTACRDPTSTEIAADPGRPDSTSSTPAPPVADRHGRRRRRGGRSLDEAAAVVTADASRCSSLDRRGGRRARADGRDHAAPTAAQCSRPSPRRGCRRHRRPVVSPSTWFCPGVPATGEDGVGGDRRVANTGDERDRRRLTVLTVDGGRRASRCGSPPYDGRRSTSTRQLPSPIGGAVVEIDGGGGLVEQQAVDPAGTVGRRAPTPPRTTWYLATGYTVEAAGPDRALQPERRRRDRRLEFATSPAPPAVASCRTSRPGRSSVKVIDLGRRSRRPGRARSRVERRSPRAAARRRPGPALPRRRGRPATVMTLARRHRVTSGGSPMARRAAASPIATRSTTRPTTTSRSTPVILGIPTRDPTRTDHRASHEVVTFDSGRRRRAPRGPPCDGVRPSAQPSIVIERAITHDDRRSADDDGACSGPRHGRGRLRRRTWYVAIGPTSRPRPRSSSTTSTTPRARSSRCRRSAPAVACRPSGPGRGHDRRRAALSRSISPIRRVVGQPLIIRSTVPVFVERSLPREPDAQGRVSVVGRSRRLPERRLEMDRLLLAVGIVGGRGRGRRRGAPPRGTDAADAADRSSTRSSSTEPTSPTGQAVAGRRVHVGDVRRLRGRRSKAEVLATRRGGRGVRRVPAAETVHERYRIDAVPLRRDRRRPRRRAAVVPRSGRPPTDLWAGVAAAQRTGRVERSGRREASRRDRRRVVGLGVEDVHLDVRSVARLGEALLDSRRPRGRRSVSCSSSASAIRSRPRRCLVSSRGPAPPAR